MKRKKLYIRPSSGISGSSFLALLLDLGASGERLSEKISSVIGKNAALSAEKYLRGGILCSKLKLAGDFDADIPNFRELKRIISENPCLKAGIREKCMEAFGSLAEAAGKIIGIAPEEIPPKKMWNWNDIISVAGCAFCFEELGIEEIISAPIPWGNPDTANPESMRDYAVSLNILQGVPLNINASNAPAIAPAAAAILKTFVSSFGVNFYGIPEAAGYSAENGTSCAFAGFIFTEGKTTEDEVACFTANIDDMTGEELGYLSYSLMKEAGVLDVSYVPAYGKKNRPLYILNIIGEKGSEESIIKFIFKNSSTAGLRIERTRRAVMEREFIETEVLGGKVKVKRLFYKGIEKFYPEWEDCRALSERSGKDVGEVYAMAKAKAVL